MAGRFYQSTHELARAAGIPIWKKGSDRIRSPTAIGGGDLSAMQLDWGAYTPPSVLFDSTLVPGRDLDDATARSAGPHADAVADAFGHLLHVRDDRDLSAGGLEGVEDRQGEFQGAWI